jgi:radical SAM protein with 4Fe4S-binding SPASM domain
LINLLFRVGANYERIIENVRRFKEIRNNHQSMKPVTRINFIKLPDMELQEIDDMIALFSPLVDSIGLLDYIDPYKKVAGNFNKDYKSKFVCSQILTRLTIYEDGRVFPCCMDYDDELYLGNLNTQSIKEIWKSKKLAAIRKAHIDGKFFKIPSCASCEFALKGDADAS